MYINGGKAHAPLLSKINISMWKKYITNKHALQASQNKEHKTWTKTKQSCTHPHWSKELMSQMTPWVKIFISYITIRAPRVNGVIRSTMMELVGRLPSNTLWGRIRFFWSSGMPALVSSASTSAGVLPLIRASVWAKKLARSSCWWGQETFVITYWINVVS